MASEPATTTTSYSEEEIAALGQQLRDGNRLIGEEAARRPVAIRWRCPRCGQPFTQAQRYDARDHSCRTELPDAE